jgi:hypothetical protein
VAFLDEKKGSIVGDGTALEKQPSLDPDCRRVRVQKIKGHFGPFFEMKAPSVRSEAIVASDVGTGPR